MITGISASVTIFISGIHSVETCPRPVPSITIPLYPEPEWNRRDSLLAPVAYFIRAHLDSSLSWSISFFSPLFTNEECILIALDGYSTRPMGLAFIDWKASRRDVCILRTFVPLWILQKSSLVEPCITTHTSAISLAATAAAHMAFMVLSLLGLSALLWEPTSTIGTGVSIMNERAAAVYIIVSVPCVIITPSAPFLISSYTARASSIQ